MRCHRGHPRAVRGEKRVGLSDRREALRLRGGAEQDSEFAQELPAFVAAIQRLFSASEIRAYLDHLERTKFLAPPESETEMEDEEEEVDDEPWPANPVSGAQELLRFSRVRQLLQS